MFYIELILIAVIFINERDDDRKIIIFPRKLKRAIYD